MKQIIKVLAVFSLLLIFVVSCVDNPIESYDVEKPASITEMEYLNDYDALKTYVDRSANPGFMLGAGVTVSEYVKKGLVYRFINSNFDQVTAGNAMKYNSIVKDDGSMDFSKITPFIEAARSAGISIYGHTLVWHAQQNKKYLEALIADKEIEIDPDATEQVVDGFTDYAVSGFVGWAGGEVPIKPYVENGVLVVKNPTVIDPFYHLQYHVASNISIKENTKHKVTIRIKATSEGEITVALGTWGAQQNTKLPITEDWTEVSVELNSTVTAGDAFVMIQSGNFAGTYEVAWVKVTHEVAAAVSWWTNLVSNSDAETDDVSSFFATEKAVGPGPARFSPAGTGADGAGRAIIVESGANPVNPWDTQFFVRVPKVFEEGEAYRFSMKIKAEKPAGSESQAHKEPGGYLHYSMIGNPAFTTEWKEYSYSGTINASQVGMSTIAFNLSVFGEANTYYFDDILWEIEESGNKIPQTPEQKADTLTWALENWIAGIMTASEDYVTSWDVVNEAISGSDSDGDGFYDLESASNVSEESAKNNFYWQDYLGDDFTRIAVRLAREYGPADLKLFVNDYNLESDWDDNKKLKSLINWIDRWESDGVTKIDGIGTQMHVSCHMNPTTQASKEAHIVKMYELMAATGKLVKVTEFDMGIVDADGNTVLTDNVTEDQKLAMTNFYKFIVGKYFEIIPVSQRAGITHWSPVDSPKESSWRGDQPIGLWSLKYARKHTFSGFADGLSGK